MKHLCEIWVLLIAVALSLQSDLIAIDTLMQTHPDSALTLLLDKEVDDPYYQLLLSEALYKNDYTQANRDELLEAMAYFDSVHDPFLSARCHYMNGVGYHEMDSVVPACEEYMKAIQIMEEHYSEKELVGLKAKYMALAYTKLTVLFSDQYFHEQAIYFGKQALHYYYKHDAEPWHVAWILNRIGIHFDIIEQNDSAEFYYDKALDFLPDTNSLTFRDNATSKVFLTYRREKNAQRALQDLHRLVDQAESENEYLARCFILGDVFYQEAMYDSAWIYLSIAFNNSSITEVKKQSAEWLAEICEYQGKYDELPKYANFLIPFATQNEDNSTVKSQLTEFYNTFCQNTLERNHQLIIKEQTKRLLLISAGLLVVIIILFILYHNSNKRNSLEAFLKEPVCQHILNIVNDTAFKAKMDYKIYTDIALNKEQLLALRLAADKHYHGFARKLRSKYPGLTDDDLNHCCLLLLGLEEAAISGLLQKSYTAVCDRNRKLKKVLSIKEDLFDEIRNI